jgi:hypothetical protein
MKHEQELIQKIIELVRTSRMTRTPQVEDLADSYANLCIGINARLMKCAEFIEKGMRSEAVHEAQVAPAVLELVRMVQFQEVAKWRAFCQEQQLPVAPQVHNEIADKLRKELPKEQEMDPLLRQYRRLVHQGKSNESMTLLRQIIALDPANPVWKENLAALEDEHFDDQLHEIDLALKQNDTARLQALYDEALHPTRVLPFPSDIVQQVRRALQAEQREEIEQRAVSLCASISDHVAARDANLLQADLTQWESMTNNEVFEASAAQLGLIARARSELDGLQKAAERRKQENELLEVLKDALRPSVPKAKPLNAALHALRQEEFTVPEALQADVDKAFAAIDKAKQRRKSLILGVSFAIVLVVFAGLGTFIVQNIQNSHWQSFKAASLIDLKDADFEVGRARETLIGSTYPQRLTDPEISAAITDLKNRIEKRKHQEELFNRSVVELKAVAKGGYAEPDEVITLKVNEAIKIAELDKPMLAAVDGWKKDWEIFKVNAKKGPSEKITAAVRAARDILNRLQWDKDSEISMRSAKRRCDEVQQQLEEVRFLTAKAEPAAVDSWNQARAEYDSKKQLLDTALDELTREDKEYKKELAEIERALPDLPLYARLLEKFINRFPAKSETAMFQTILAWMPTYQATVSLANVSCEGAPTKASIAAAKSVLDVFGKNEACIWKNELALWIAQSECSGKLRQEIDNLLVARPPEMFDAKVIYVRSAGTLDAKEQPLYFPINDEEGIPQKVNSQTRKEGEREYTQYWVRKAYRLNRKGDIETVHTAAIFPRGLFTSITHTIRTAKNLEGFAVPHDTWLIKLLAEAKQSDDIEQLVINRILELTTDTEIPIIPRAWLIQRLVAALKTAIPGENGYDEYYQFTSTWNTSVAWIDDTHPAVVKVDRDMQEGIRKLAGLRKTYLARKERMSLIAAALSRKVTVGGSFQQDPLTKQIRLSPCVGNISEGWILASPTPGARPTFKIVIRGAGGVPVLQPEFNNEVKPGQLFFVPADGRDTNQLFLQLKGKSEAAPACWPRNGIPSTSATAPGAGGSGGVKFPGKL